MRRTFICLLLALAGHSNLLQAQPGSIDASFSTGQTLNGFVTALALQPDGRVIVSGTFTTVGGSSRGRIARLTASGGLDASFNPGTGFTGSFTDINEMLLQPDGKVLVGGSFTAFNGTVRNYIVRLNPDGSQDAGFNSGTGFNGEVYTFTLQPDGKILVGGSFITYNGVRRVNYLRLNADGTLDLTFVPHVNGLNGGVKSMVLLANGKILVGGDFTLYGTSANPRRYIARLNADGTLDAGFVPAGTSFNGVVAQLAVQSDGKILAVGAFRSYDGAARAGIARLNSDGSLDATFSVGTGFAGTPERIRLLPNGQVLAAGSFASFNGVQRRNVAALNANGTLDTSFGNTTGFDNAVLDVAVQPDGKILVGGVFANHGITPARYAARLNGSTASATRPTALPAWSLYPGSAPGQWLVAADQPLTSLHVTDALGRAVGLPAVSGLARPAVLDLSRHPAGVYFVRAGWGADYRTGRVVKE